MINIDIFILTFCTGPELLAGQACFPFAVLVAQNLLSLGFIYPGTFSYPTTFGLYDFNILNSLYNSDSKFEDFDNVLRLVYVV
jgi:hypothetical protein